MACLVRLENLCHQNGFSRVAVLFRLFQMSNRYLYFSTQEMLFGEYGGGRTIFLPLPMPPILRGKSATAEGSAVAA
jgi:hypothetical protein